MPRLELVRSGAGDPLFVRRRGLLDDEERRRLMEATLAERKWLVDASTGGRDDYRWAQVLYTVVDEADRVKERVRALAPEVFETLGVGVAAVRRIECQQTIHPDGGFYRRHRDDQGDDVAARALTYVYYHHRTPKRFEGGELVIVAPDGDERIVVPEDGLLVLFPSELEHEVRPVRVPSGDLADGRFTVNGWLWRG